MSKILLLAALFLSSTPAEKPIVQPELPKLTTQQQAELSTAIRVCGKPVLYGSPIEDSALYAMYKLCLIRTHGRAPCIGWARYRENIVHYSWTCRRPVLEDIGGSK